MIIKFINIIVTFSIFFVLFMVVFDFIKTLVFGNRDLKKIRKWSDFNKEKLSYIDEIKDPLVKQQYIEWCLDNSLLGGLETVKKNRYRQTKERFN